VYINDVMSVQRSELGPLQSQPSFDSTLISKPCKGCCQQQIRRKGKSWNVMGTAKIFEQAARMAKTSAAAHDIMVE
jgi:hypothetical protein